MAKSFTAKVKAVKVQPVGDGQTSLTFTAHYSDDQGNRVNEEWAMYTPNAQFSMTVLDSVAEGITEGLAYTVTFTPEAGSDG